MHWLTFTRLPGAPAIPFCFVDSWERQMCPIPVFGALVARRAPRWPSSFQSSYLETFSFPFPQTFIPGRHRKWKVFNLSPKFLWKAAPPRNLVASLPGNRNFLDPLRGPQLRAARPRITIDLFFRGGHRLLCQDALNCGLFALPPSV